MPNEPKVEVVLTMVDANQIRAGGVRVDCDGEPGSDFYLMLSDNRTLCLDANEVHEAHACLNTLVKLMRDRGIEYKPEED